MQWLVLALLILPDAGWIVSRIVEDTAVANGPFRVVWNGETAPADIEHQLLIKGLTLTTALDAARVEIRHQTGPTGDTELHIRVLDADGVVLSSRSHRRTSDLPTWKRAWLRYASPVLITAATGITVYLLYNVRSR
jgi:hypothetical protein